jgi:hypothetical protein
MSQPSHHDAVFRRVLGEPANAASQLRSVLPAELAERLDLDQLTRVSENFVDEDLQWRHTDLLFTAPLDGLDAFIYVLVEHQSRTDPLMPFRMLHYIVRIWDRYLKDHRGATRLPAVLPLVVHHNRRPWNGPTDISEMFDLDAATWDAAGAYLPRFRFLLDDLTHVDAQELRDRPLTPSTRITLLLLKIAAGNARLADDLRPWADDLRAILETSGGIEDFRALVTYIGIVGEARPNELRELFTELGPAVEEAYMTTAEMLRAEGRAEGGADILEEQLTHKFGPLSRATLDTVHGATTEQLKRWATRVLTATTLDEVFR